MAITRRQFLTRTGWAGAGALFGPRLFGSPWLQRASAATIGDRYFIVLFLDGGNDGLNTIIPVSGGTASLRTHYETARRPPAGEPGGDSGGIRIMNPLAPSRPMLDPNSGTQLGFHPGFASLSDMYDDGMVAVIQGCGYPDYNLSHEISRSIWERGNPYTTLGSGWVGRYLQAAMYSGGNIPAVNIGGSVAGEYLQTATSVLVFNQLEYFGFPYDYDFDYDDTFDDTAYKDAALLALHTQAKLPTRHPSMQYVGNTGSATLDATAAYPAAHAIYATDRPDWLAKYQNDDPPYPDGLNTSTARGFREIAKVIYGVAKGTIPATLAARHFQLRNGGYDTHSNQGSAETDGEHYRLHEEVGDAIKLFYEDLADMAAGAGPVLGLQNLPNKVCVLVWSEFSRRIEQNDNGTDHGSQGPMLVIGGPNAIQGATSMTSGVYGNHPNITPQDDDPTNGIDDDGNSRYSQDNGNPHRSTDIRDVYGTIINRWLGLDPTALLPLDSDLGFSGPDYWTQANFNMGFLP
jgi:uncharacterized protein (DUF1501 family)